MAEACRLANQVNKENNTTINHDENFCVFNVLCVFISLITILADLTTDILVSAEYCKNGYIYWALATLIFILTPNVLINIFSMRWFILDQKSNLRHWIAHISLFGLLERYVLFLRKVFACKNLEADKTQTLLSQRNDLSLLHFLYIFTGTIPQVILQTYAIVTLDGNYHTKVFALTASSASVVWGCTTYIYSITTFSNDNLQWISFLIRLFWHFGMLLARISGILLFTVVFGIWTLLPLGLHWTAMTFWIVLQNTTFCPNKLEETLYNVVMGFVYCFCYINLREGHTRYRLVMFYTLMVTQNFGSLFLYVLISDSEIQRKPWSIAATACVIAGTILGMCAMVMYYRYFHSKGPISWKASHEDVELNNKVFTKNPLTSNAPNGGLKHVRSFKTTQESKVNDTTLRNEKSELNQTGNSNPDKSNLIDQWVARSGSPTFTAAVGNSSVNASSIELYTVENTPQSLIQPPKPNKKITICSPTELTLKLSSLETLESSIDKLTSSNLNLQKRRGICSSDELREDFTDLNLDACNVINQTFDKTLKIGHGSELSQDTSSSNKKTSSDSIDMDLDLSFSDINSSDINTFNENIVQKLCLSALKNIKVGNQDADIENIQRIALDILKEMYDKKDKSKSNLHRSSLTPKRDLDTPTEILSVHDYENICAVNIAREAWGLRSWNGYCDIENWLHDGSVVRDRRRDTLTSASTEISSCMSQEFKNAISAAPPFPKKVPTYSNVFIKFDKSYHEDYVHSGGCHQNDETFLAKPCIVDGGKDPNQLEPIIEEIDDLGDVGTSNKKRLNSESSLVATIDEIRKATVTSSPRNLYHRTQLWDSPQFNTSVKMECNLKKALWKEPSKFDSSNTMESLPEKENMLNICNPKFDSNKKELNFSQTTPLDLDNEENVLSCSKNRKRHKININNPSSQMKKNNKPDQHLQDLSNRNIDFLWQLVSETSLPLSSNEDLSPSRKTSSLLSLIQKDPPPTVNKPVAKVTNMKKGAKNRPRRKFSILRERFESKAHFNSDEEILCHYSDSKVNQSGIHFLNVKNNFITTDEAGIDIQHPVVKLAPEKEKRNDTDNVHVNYSSLSKNIKEKRSIFMKQVLSPPKFNTKLRYKV